MTNEDPANAPGLETLVVAFMGADGHDAVIEATQAATHLKAMWERLRVGKVHDLFVL